MVQPAAADLRAVLPEVLAWYRGLWWVERASPALGAFLARKAFDRYRKLLADAAATPDR